MEETSCKFVSQSYLARPCSDARIERLEPGQEVMLWRVKKAGHFIIGQLKDQTVEVFKRADAALQDFANVQNDPKDILRFVKRYGVLRQRELETVEVPDEPPILRGKFFLSCDGWLHHQSTFRGYWELGQKDSAEMARLISFELGLYGSAPTPVDIQVVPDVRGLELRLQPVDLWQALCLMLVSFAGRLRKCQNESCPGSPYFIATRRDQKYCNENCSRLVANRRWWNAKGPEWRQEWREKRLGNKAKRRKSAKR